MASRSNVHIRLEYCTLVSLFLVLGFPTKVKAQICNSNDPEKGGGLLIPAFTSIGCPNNIAINQSSSTPDDLCVWPENNPDPIAIVYFILLMWMFMGVGAAADMFMEAIEMVTSKLVLKQVVASGKVRTIEYKVWNATVANLTLMALGSSAPEILLSVIEIVGNKFYIGDLGPSTIVGSAAFNLMCISAVCLVAIPVNEVRKISQLTVFSITALSSVFAYVWLYIILRDDMVRLWEAAVTFLFFPILCLFAYFADKGYFTPKAVMESKISEMMILSKLKMHKRSMQNIEQGQFSSFDVRNLLRGVGVRKMKANDAVQMALHKFQASQVKSRLAYRLDFVKRLQGKAGRFIPRPVSGKDAESNTIRVAFEAVKVRGTEQIGFVVCRVVRIEGKGAFSVDYETIEGTATLDGVMPDFIYAKGTLHFSARQTHKDIVVKIVDDDEDEDDEEFYVDLSNGKARSSKQTVDIVESRCTVVITGDAEGGSLGFNKENLVSKKDVQGDGDDGNSGGGDEREGEKGRGNGSNGEAEFTFMESVGVAHIPVVRMDGSRGSIEARVISEDGTAVGGRDFQTVDHTLVFLENELEKVVKVQLYDDESLDSKDLTFNLKLIECEGGSIRDDDAEVVVHIVNDESINEIVDAVTDVLESKLNEIGGDDEKHTWFGQVKASFGGPESRDLRSIIGWALSLPFNIMIAIFVPPVHMGGGWPCFVMSLGLIGFITAVIGDLAGLFGCAIGLKDAVTAITVVALGTSLPDTFASMTAAKQDSDADASLGNITGSNSVNVFLGLGMPWLIAAIVWEGGVDDEWRSKYPDLDSKGESGFAVPAGNLGTSVVTFSILAIMTIGTLYYRRFRFGAELGGPLAKPTAIMFVGFWITYVIISSLNVYGKLGFSIG